MIYGLIFIAIWAFFGVIGPIRKEGVRNRHNAIFLEFTRQSKQYPNLKPFWPWVQELGEWRLCKLIGVALGLVTWALFAATTSDPVLVILVPALVTVTADSLTRKFYFLDAAGHGAEILTATAAGLPDYKMEEILRMTHDINWSAKFGNAKNDTNKRMEVADKIEAYLNRFAWLAKIVRKLGSGAARW